MSIKRLKEQYNIFLDLSLDYEQDFINLDTLKDSETFMNFLNRYYVTDEATLSEASEIFIDEFTLPYFILDMFSKHNTIFNVESENIYLKKEVGRPLLIYVTQYQLRKFEGDRKAALYKLTYDLYNFILNPIIFNCVRLTNTKSIYYYEKTINKITKTYKQENTKPSLNENDYKHIMSWLKEERNEFFYDPFNFDLKEVYVSDLNKAVKVRKTCCMRYMIKGQNRCFTCPQIIKK